MSNENAKTLKNFEDVVSNYSFFEKHSTELESLRALILELLADFSPKARPVSFLDLGCGDGNLSVFLESRIPALKGNTKFWLIEPSDTSREKAIRSVGPLSRGPLEAHHFLPDRFSPAVKFDLGFSIHSLYYVPNLEVSLGVILERMGEGSMFLAAVENSMSPWVVLWQAFFRLLGKPLPYNLSEDIEKALKSLRANYRIESCRSVTEFPDTTENRRHVARFLCEPYYSLLPELQILSLFDPLSAGGKIRTENVDDVFVTSAVPFTPQANRAVP